MPVEIEEQDLVQKLVAHLTIDTFDIAILHGPAGSDVVPVNPAIPGPCADGVGREFCAVVRNNHARLSPPCDDG